MFYKSARVEYHPLGVVGAIVPWNYPFHNVFNPLTAALFAGNALVIKVKLYCLNLLTVPQHTYQSCLQSGTCAGVRVTCPDLLQGSRLVSGGLCKLEQAAQTLMTMSMMVHAGVRACILVEQILWAHHFCCTICCG